MRKVSEIENNLPKVTSQTRMLASDSKAKSLAYWAAHVQCWVQWALLIAHPVIPNRISPSVPAQ